MEDDSHFERWTQKKNWWETKLNNVRGNIPGFCRKVVCAFRCPSFPFFDFFEPLTYDLHRDSLGVFLFSLERAFCFLRNLILAVNKLLLRVEQKCITASSVRPDLWYFDISIECVCVCIFSLCVWVWSEFWSKTVQLMDFMLRHMSTKMF